MADPDVRYFGDDDSNTGYNRVWFNLMRVQRSSGARIARALRKHGIEDPIWYEILMELDHAWPEGIPMAQLEGKLYLPQYALSRHASRMVKAGLVRREALPGRGRGQALLLTDEGIGMHARMWDDYVAIIRAEFGHRLTVDEAYDLMPMLFRLCP